jgi:pyruvate dehydrogenase E1 component alpha subunit
VFVIANNQWAISLPRRAQTGTETLAQKAVAAGFAGTQVDGNDVIAVHEATRRALERARSGGGPALIEAITYRLGDHTTADDARRYRDDAEVSPHWDEEPVKRLRQHLVDAHGWGRDDEEALIEDCRQQVETAANAYEAREPEPASAMFDTLFETLPRALADQRAAAIADAEASDD